MCVIDAIVPSIYHGGNAHFYCVLACENEHKEEEITFLCDSMAINYNYRQSDMGNSLSFFYAFLSKGGLFGCSVMLNYVLLEFFYQTTSDFELNIFKRLNSSTGYIMFVTYK